MRASIPILRGHVVFQRIERRDATEGVTPSMAPLFSPSGLVYRYVLESPDRSPQELKTYEDWIIERAYRSVPGVADDSGLGGPTMQYQVLLDPARLYNYHLSVVQVVNALAANNANTGGGFYSQGGQFYYVRGLGLVKSTDGYRRSGGREQQRRSCAGERCRAQVVIGNAPRLGIFGFQTKRKKTTTRWKA